MSQRKQSDSTQEFHAQQEVIHQEQVASHSVAYTDESVARQIYGTNNVAQAVKDAEQQALSAVAATE
ncbi:hypothetical protein TW78_01530 [Vibrio coralliilyticus]|uniref:Uncharacterized protein n=2 Tax=Vibrio TaxID=662 RepID=A0A837G1N1_9VIBR|nr:MULTISPECIES: hypothetical protein [Vibrio]KJY79408.1 hypothetical protein TW78_01530 [Vibrio coralliilyticus]KJY93142.1 hypothetical protein TW84_04525 [Vibrio neptunius]MBN3492718.1 hypothetical protein [Vibrio neptunius]MBN3515215.1 hypothetical protein [Vibrio neptunius]MBN3548909.1 hypothetical protein [Vibrio neptunius]